MDTVDSKKQVTRYEDLRRQVVGDRGGHRLGRALFQREGMKAWLDAWSDCAMRETRPQRDGCDASDLANHLNGDLGELVRLLAGMAMGTLQPEVQS